MLDFLKVNQIINIEIESDSEFSNNYRTRVEEINENGFMIGIPIDRGVYVPLRPGSEVIVWHWDNAASYAYYCRVRERILEPLPLVFLEWPYKSKKAQRRDFVRIPVSLSLEYRVENGAKSEETFHTGVIRDLSGGGAQLASKRKLVKGTILQVKFSLPEDLIVCKAKVMWVYTEVKEQKETYLIGLKFIDINERLRERIIRYVFKRQRELIQKGVL